MVDRVVVIFLATLLSKLPKLSCWAVWRKVVVIHEPKKNFGPKLVADASSFWYNGVSEASKTRVFCPLCARPWQPQNVKKLPFRQKFFEGLKSLWHHELPKLVFSTCFVGGSGHSKASKDRSARNSWQRCLFFSSMIDFQKLSLLN